MSQSAPPDCLQGLKIVMPTAPHQKTLIFLHGRGSNAKEFSTEIFESQASDDRTLPRIFPHLKWVFPSAPIIPAARLDGQPISQWFDMYSTDNPHDRQDEQLLNIERSCREMHAIIAAEAETIGHNNVFIGGISQGCATAVAALLTYPRPLAGFIGLSSWLPPLKQNKSGTKNATPVFLEHCANDEVIHVKHGVHLRQSLTATFSSVSWKEYENGGHWLNEPNGVDDMVEFIMAQAHGPSNLSKG